MIYNQTTNLDPTHLLAVTPSTTHGLAISIMKFGANDAVNFPSLESYVRQTFNPHIECDSTSFGITIQRAGIQIASRTRRGAGNHFFTGPNTNFPTLNPIMHSYLNVGTLDFLAPDEALITYAGTSRTGVGNIDAGFVWKENDDSTIDVIAMPVSVINQTRDYGQFLRLI